VNTFGSDPGFMGCFGGDTMLVSPGQNLQMLFQLLPGTTIWRQTVTNLDTQYLVSFDVDLQGQEQLMAQWVVETPGGWHANPPAFLVKDITFQTNASTSIVCQADYVMPENVSPAATLYCSEPVVIGNQCIIDQCIFNN
jgi:hypothetical protein